MKNLVFLILFIVFLVSAGLVSAQLIVIPNPLCLGGPGPGCVNTFETLIFNITTFIFGIVGSLATVMFIWAGILFVTSAGNPGRIDQARKATIYAAVGAAIAIAGSGLIALVRTIITGV
mgnify:CR=1 FL=1